jgi:hypothetical protein
MTNVGLDEGDVGAAAAKFCFECFAFRVPAASDDDAGVILGEGDSGGATDAGQRTCDQDDGAAHGPSPPRLFAALLATATLQLAGIWGLLAPLRKTL